MKIYIIGGHGFIGRHLTAALLSKTSHDIEVLDPKELPPHSGYKHTASRVNDVPLAHFSRGLYIHLASNSQHNATIAESKKDLDAVLHVVGAAALNGSGVLIASTSAVSGGSTPVALYGRASEVYSAAFKPHCKVGFMRIYSVYGPGQHNNFVKRALKAALNDSTLTITNENCIRDWIHVEDVVQAILGQILAYENYGKISAVTHIGTGIGLPIKSALEIICSVTGKRISVDYDGKTIKNEPIVSVAQKIQPGWSAQTTFYQGIRALWESKSEDYW